MSAVTVSTKGWVVIPATYRRKYDMTPGTRVEVVDYGGGLALVPSVGDPVVNSRGILKGDSSLTEKLLMERNRERAREKAKSEIRTG